MKEKQEEKKMEVDAVKAAEGESREKAVKTGKSKTKRYLLTGIFALVVIFVGLVGFGYYQAVMYYKTHFFPNTTINGIDCGDMEVGPVVKMLDERSRDYLLEVTGRDCRTGASGTLLGTVTSENIRLNIGETEAMVSSFLDQQKEHQWIGAYLNGAYPYFLEQGIFFDEGLLEEEVRTWDACIKTNMVKAQDAYISEYSAESGTYEIIPETMGTELDLEKAVLLITDAVRRQDEKIDLEEGGCYKEAAVKQDDRKLTEIVDQVNKWLSTKITYDWNGTKVMLDYETLHEWISLENGKPVLDEEKAAAFVKQQAAEYDTYGRKKNLKNTDSQISLS